MKNICYVAMPLVQLIGSRDISWADREKCAEALAEVLRQYKAIENEQVGKMVGAAMSQQQGR